MFNIEQPIDAFDNVSVAFQFLILQCIYYLFFINNSSRVLHDMIPFLFLLFLLHQGCTAVSLMLHSQVQCGYTN